MFKIELNEEGVKELLQSDEMMSVCRNLANGIARRAGDGFETSEFTGKTRVNVSVRAESKKAIKACYKDNALLKAMGQ